MRRYIILKEGCTGVPSGVPSWVMPGKYDCHRWVVQGDKHQENDILSDQAYVPDHS